MSDFELKKSSRSISKPDNSINPEIVQNTNDNALFNKQNADKLIGAAADNFGTILNIVADIVDIQKMKEKSDAVVRELNAKGDYLIKEAKAYVAKKEADTNHVIEKMQVVRSLLNDFNKCEHPNMSGDEFSKVITQFIDKFDK